MVCTESTRIEEAYIARHIKGGAATYEYYKLKNEGDPYRMAAFICLTY